MGTKELWDLDSKVNVGKVQCEPIDFKSMAEIN